MKLTFEIQYDTRWGEDLFLDAGGTLYPLQWTEGGLWRGTFEFNAAGLEDYGYVIMRDGIIVRSEWDRHHFRAHKGENTVRDSWIDCPVPGCGFKHRHQAEIFDRPGFRGAGTAIPVFSLRTEDDFGIGDFRDLRPLVDWAAATGQTVIQLLPVNDTTRRGEWEDSYPYSPVSSFALHPLYVRLQDLGVREDEAFRQEQAALNELPEVDYPRVFKAKMGRIRQAFDERGKVDMGTPAFKDFCSGNAFWLDEYASFCAERDCAASEKVEFFDSSGKGSSGRSGECRQEADFYRWLQYHLDRQFSEEVAYARSMGVHFKGDLPIGVSADSVEARFHPQLFNLDSCAGAPPDFFSQDGQNWGFPTYNWDAMASDGYSWWKKRLRHMSRWFDAFRIDHILGFFRIWEIPAGERSGKAGHFNPALPYRPEEIGGLPIEGLFHEDPRHPGMYQPLISPDTAGLDDTSRRRFDALWEDFFFRRHEEFWRRNAMKKLPSLLGATGMLACGEDLGMVPKCVPGVMDELQILSLEMPMMDKGRPWPRLSVCASSSHDMETLRQQTLRSEGADPGPWQVRRLLEPILSSDSMLAIFPLQDWVALSQKLRRPNPAEERINEPADPHHHWRYRFHLPLGTLFQTPEFCTEVASLLKDSSRFRDLS